jgi:hypothetical protein
LADYEIAVPALQESPNILMRMEEMRTPTDWRKSPST